MLSWTLAAVAGLAIAVAQYVWREPRSGGAATAAALRGAAIALLIALVLGAPAGSSRATPPLVALDVSASWRRGGDQEAWTRALARIAETGADTVLLLGDSLRAGAPPAEPGDRQSRVRPAVDRALASGRPLLLVTDGEVEDPEAVLALPGQSRIEVVPRAAVLDAALLALELPRAAVGGDTVETRVSIGAGAGGAGPAIVAVHANERELASVNVDSLAAYAERDVVLSLRLPAAEGPTLVRATIRSRGDAEPGNDTLRAVVDLSRAAGVVFVSTSPDYDARYALAVLRGALALPTRGYLRVAAGEWRHDGSLAPVPESQVREALRSAPVAVIHGDSLVFGSPRAATRGALALLAPPEQRVRGGDWYAVGAPASPIAPTLSALQWDSLAPLEPSGASLRGDWVVLEVARARRFERRPVIAGTESPRRVIGVGASGFWRWHFRGGASAEAFSTLWGTIFDWLAAARDVGRPVSVDASFVRAGEPIPWRRGAAADSVITVAMTPHGDDGRADSITLRFPAGVNVTESPAPAPGTYDVRFAGGTALLVVNQSTEWLPRRPTLATGTVSGVAPLAPPPTLRSQGWAYALALLLLSAEWVVRRRLGMR